MANAFRGCFVGGKFIHPSELGEVSGEWICRSPADFSDELGRVSYAYAAVDKAVDAAQAAFHPWRKRPLSERVEFLRAFQVAVQRREEDFVRTISREVGKPFWESKTEISGVLKKIDVTIQDGLRLVAGFEIPKVIENATGVCRYRPLGVTAVLGPFNFPAHLPCGHIIPALATGNTVVFKPSEKAPLTGQLLAECFEQAKLPAGVFNLVQGQGEMGRRLAVHEGVQGVLFTGSSEVGTRIKQDTLQQHWKLLALQTGAKNASIVWDDATLDIAIQETLVSAYITAGQRCTGTSRIIVHNKVLQRFVDQFHLRAKAFAIGHPEDEPFMGPLIEQGSVDRYMKFLGIAAREGSELIMRGKALDTKREGCYVTPSICWEKNTSIEHTKKSVFQQSELFAPAVTILGVDSLEHAIAQANATQYGLVCSVFTASRANFDKCIDDLEMGVVNWNKSTVGASSRLPFGGLKKSGNHFPAALTSTLYCTSPIASLEVAEPQAALSYLSYPGLNWNR